MEYPKEIYLDGYTYTQMYEHEKGGMYRWKINIFMGWI